MEAPRPGPPAAESGTPFELPALPRLAGVDVQVLRHPLQRPVATSFGIMRDRPAVLVRVRDEDGACGFGEAWCNFPAPGPEYRARLIADVLAPLLIAQGQPLHSPAQAWQLLTRRTHVLALQCGEPGPFAQGLAAIEQALWDLLARRLGQPLWRVLGGRGRVPVYASGIHPDEAESRIADARAAGHERFKLKVGFDRARDLAVLRRHVQAHPGTAWMVDANQAWDEDAAAAAIGDLRTLPLAWIEEPVAADAAPTAWRRLAGIGARLAGGENLRGLPAFEESADWLGVLQPDVGKWGGVGGGLAVAALAHRHGPWFCPHWLGSGVGLAFSLAVLDGALAQHPGLVGWAEVDVNPNPLRDGLIRWCEGIDSGDALLVDEPGIGGLAWPPAV